MKTFFVLLFLIILSTACNAIADSSNTTTEDDLPTLNTTAIQILNRCKRNLVNNSFMEDGFSGYWSPTNGGVLSVTRGMRDSKAIRYSNRTDSADGVAYETMTQMDLSCLTPGSTYEISAFFKLFNSTDGKYVSCTAELDCPKVRVFLVDDADNVVFMKYLSGYVLRDDVWNRVGFNRFRQEFTLPDNSAWDGTIKVWKIHVREFPQEVDLLMDNFRLRKVFI